MDHVAALTSTKEPDTSDTKSTIKMEPLHRDRALGAIDLARKLVELWELWNQAQ